MDLFSNLFSSSCFPGNTREFPYLSKKWLHPSVHDTEKVSSSMAHSQTLGNI